ncbi:MAG: ATP-dependent zinc protease family protein [Syntrophales bacterium]
MRKAPAASCTRLPAFGGRQLSTALCAVIVCFVAFAALLAEAKDKVRLGAVENVVLLPWGVLMPARIDTGAATSSLDARNLTVKGNTAEFSLPPEYGGRRVKLPILKWRTVRTSEGEERRPVVVVELCIGSQRIRTRVNLNNRANVKYPLLIGRNTLSRGFVVECGTSYCTQPSCPEVRPK